MSHSIKVIDGDISFDALGQLVFVDKEEGIIQSVLHRLSTFKGDLFYNQVYGLSRDFDRAKLKPKKLGNLQNIINEALSSDPNISAALISNFTKVDNDKFAITLKIFLTSGAFLEINFNA